MNKANYKRNAIGQPIWCDVKASCSTFSLGRGSMMKLASDAGAIRTVGRRVLINTEIVNSYLESKEG